MLDQAIARLKAKVPDLERVDDAASLAELLASKALSPAPVMAYVVPLGLVGTGADAMSGVIDQGVKETIGVVLVIRGTDPKGSRVLKTLHPFIIDVIAALVGWAPNDEAGVFELNRGAQLSMARGVLIYQLDFSNNDQPRITP